MNYRDMLGFPKKKAKKKVIPEPPKPSVADKLKEELNEWNDTTFKKLPKRWSGSGLTEFEQQGGKDNMNEGPAYEYANQISKIDKLYDAYWGAVKDLGKTLEKKGQRNLSKELYNNYRKQVSKFSQWFSKFSGGLM